MLRRGNSVSAELAALLWVRGGGRRESDGGLEMQVVRLPSPRDGGWATRKLPEAGFIGRSVLASRRPGQDPRCRGRPDRWSGECLMCRIIGSVANSKTTPSGSTELSQLLPCDAEDIMNKLGLPHHVCLVQPSDLPFPDHMHRLVAFDRPSGDRNPRLAMIRFLMKGWSCSMMLFK